MDVRMPLSACCRASVVEGKGSTYHYDCTKCGKGCCIKTAGQFKEEDAKKK